MHRFKLKQGNEKPYDITKKNFEELTKKEEPYVITGKDKQTRYFGICPACDNPIQLIGLYKELKNTDISYGRHYNRNAAIAVHNEQLYKFCPYASHIYSGKEKEKKDKLTDFERNIYNTVRDYFDKVIYLLGQITGFKITKKYAKEILHEYLCGEGYMYYGATYYNIPWMLLYFCKAKPIYRKLVYKKSPLYEILKNRDDISLKQYKNSPYYLVDNNGSYLNLYYSFILHERKVIKDEVKEEICFQLFSSSRDNVSTEKTDLILDINEYRFPNLIHSEKAAGFRDEELLRIAKEMMPSLPSEDTL